MAARVRKVMTQPINLIFRFLQNVRSYRVLVRGAVLVHVPSAWPACVCTCNAPPIARPCASLLLCACGVLRDVLMGWDTCSHYPCVSRKPASRSGCTNRPASVWKGASLYVCGRARCCLHLPAVWRLIVRLRSHAWFLGAAFYVFVPQGFDEYMNLVLDAAEEVDMKKGTRKALGRILLKGDNITLMMETQTETK